MWLFFVKVVANLFVYEDSRGAEIVAKKWAYKDSMGAEIVAKKWAYKDSMGRSESEYQSLEQLSTNP